MRACPSCGSPALPADLFCGACGERLAGADDPSACPRCGGDLQPTDRHCRHCGLPLVKDPGDASRTPGPVGGATQPHRAPAPSPGPTDTQVLPVPGRPRDPYLSPRTEPWTGPEEETDDVEEVERRAPRRRGGAPVGAIMAFIAALFVVASGFLPWRAPALGGGTGADVPIRFLVNPEAQVREGDPTIALVLLGLGTVGALVALLTMVVPWLRLLRRLAGSLTFLVPLVFVVRSEIALRFLSGDHPFLESIGSGVWVAAGAAVVQIVAGRWFGR